MTSLFSPQQVGNVDPAEYKRQQLSDAVGVRCVGVFISELAERMPKTTMTNISLFSRTSTARRTRSDPPWSPCSVS
jgi:hypothetical protein